MKGQIVNSEHGITQCTNQYLFNITYQHSVSYLIQIEGTLQITNVDAYAFPFR